ncbi:MAG: mandelate racemase/muconate lactonizing enzyme family protein [Armatimonadetes bacterium]|nr:mandelate racemase/muconate lactonizing enzyme family protein [Armatimonadota bacterium]
MKITDVEAIYLRLPVIEERCDGTQDTLVVRVHTDAGLTGVGEADSAPLVVRAIVEAPVSHTIQRGLRELLLGENPLEIERLWEKMYQGTLFFGRRAAAIQAMSGVDIALWDIAGKAYGQPAHRLLGGAYRQRVRAYASSLFGATPEETGRLAAGFRDQGFTAVKFGWAPMGQDEATDVALVREARRGAGRDMDVLIDAGCVWDSKTAIQRARRFQEYGIYWLEEPLHPDDLEGYARLATSVDVRIAAGEEESSRHSYVDLMDRGKIDVVQVDVTRCGGLTEARRIAWLAHDRHLPVVNHSFKTGINLAASLHFVATAPNGFILEYPITPSPLRDQLTREKFPVVDGYVTIPDAPGLGVTLDEETVSRYRVA